MKRGMVMTLGNKIQEIRLARGMSQEQFGELLDTTRQTVSKWELDQVVPDVRKIIAISRISGVSLDELLLKATNFETEGVPLSGGTAGKSTAEILEMVRLALEYYAEGMRRTEADGDGKNRPQGNRTPGIPGRTFRTARRSSSFQRSGKRLRTTLLSGTKRRLIGTRNTGRRWTGSWRPGISMIITGN